MLKKSIIVIGLVSILVSAANADRRAYVWTYQYMTLSPGMTELEFYQTTKLRQVDEWEYRIEVEQGITDRTDFSVYQIFSQRENQSFKWDAVQFRVRHRLADAGQYFLDPLLYLEYNRKTDSRLPNKLEAKLILSRTIGHFNLAMNPVYEFFFAPGTEHEAGFDLGASWQFHPKFIAGLESTSRIELGDDETETASYFGPTVSYASGKWWYTLGAAFGITDASDDARVRLLMGIGL